MATAERDEARKKRFGEFVKAHGFDDGFIDREEEKRILQEGVARFGIGLADGQAIMLGVASAFDYAIERNADSHIRELLAHYAGRSGRISRNDFNDCVAVYKVLTKGTVPEPDIKRQLKAIMEEKGWRPRPTGLLLRTRKWYREIKSDAELARLRALSPL
jgi:hypothetical protein